MKESKNTYLSAGVDIDAGNKLVKNIASIAKKTTRPEVLKSIGGFGALFELPTNKYNKPVLVSGTDGVGTKLKLAFAMSNHKTIGIDLVAMCVNDIIVSGAEPLYFLDYFATSKLDIDQTTDVVSGIADGCIQAGCALTGGETAEMPGMYKNDDYDLAGFCVGIVEKDNIIDGKSIVAGDVFIGLESSGVHSNGYSLVHKILNDTSTTLDHKFGISTIGETLLTPTKIYVKTILSLFDKIKIKAISHITGGGITENLPRVLPKNVNAKIDLNSWDMPEIFSWLQKNGAIDEDEMLKVFNCGIGMVLCISENDVEQAFSILQENNQKAFKIGFVENSNNESPAVEYTGKLIA